MKIGFGLVTYNRQDFFKESISHVTKDIADHIVVVNDGTPYDSSVYPDFVHLIQHETNKCVGVSKNDALKYLMEKGCDHLFLMEDDIILKDPTVIQKYIKLAELTGIHHYNFGFHGPANLKNGKPNPKFIINGYSEDVNLALNHHCVGAFAYFSRDIIETVGYMDERYNNCWEHPDHTYRIIKERLHPPFWFFTDLADSYKYLGEIKSSEEDSTIRENHPSFYNWRTGRWKGNEDRLSFGIRFKFVRSDQ